MGQRNKQTTLALEGEDTENELENQMEMTDEVQRLEKLGVSEEVQETQLMRTEESLNRTRSLDPMQRKEQHGNWEGILTFLFQIKL